MNCMTQALTIEGLTVRAQDGRILLDVPQFALAPGTSLGIRGPSGAGKSTLLYALAGLLDNVDGRIVWGTTEISRLSPSQRASFRNQNIGMIFQDFLLFEELGAAENASISAMFSPRAQRKSLSLRAKTQLDRLGISSSPRDVTSFSGGERQRVAVARAIATDPDILLADEPTASLHREAADRLIQDLVALVKQGGKTLVAVSHDPAFLARMDRVIEIADGCISASISGRDANSDGRCVDA